MAFLSSTSNSLNSASVIEAQGNTVTGKAHGLKFLLLPLSFFAEPLLQVPSQSFCKFLRSFCLLPTLKSWQVATSIRLLHKAVKQADPFSRSLNPTRSQARAMKTVSDELDAFLHFSNKLRASLSSFCKNLMALSMAGKDKMQVLYTTIPVVYTTSKCPLLVIVLL